MTERFSHFLPHLTELRQRVLFALFFLFITFGICFLFSQALYEQLALPLLRQLPAKKMIATAITTPFVAPLKLSFVTAIFLTIPFIFWQGWQFVAPGLYQHEKKVLKLALCVGTLLFYAGAVFAYFVVFPLLFRFFSALAPQGVVLMPDMQAYLEFSLRLLMIFGAVFEIPLVMFVLARLGLVKPQTFIEKRPYIIVLAFVIGMLVTPPDVLSQIVVAVPMCLLYELGIFAVKPLMRAALRS